MHEGFFGLMTCPISYDWAALLVRLAVGLALLPYGLLKFSQRHENHDKFPKVPFFSPDAAFTAAMWIELITPLCLIFGFLTRLAVLPAIGSMAVATKVNHGKFCTAPALVYFFMMIAIFFIGSGNYSLDRLFQ